jgi:hypothetical protein
MDERSILETGAAALVFAAVFLVGGHVYPMRAILRNERSMLSFSAGIALAYVFVHVMPELSAARDTFVKFTFLPTVFQGMAVYFLALLGFLFFYSLDQLSKQARLATAEGEPAPGFDLKLIGFTGYVCLISYLLVNNLESSALASAAYALAMAVHFITFDHSFREAPGDAYARRGHLLLAAAALVGWGLGLAIALPRGALALMLGFLSGGIIVNTAILELPTGKDGKMWPFIAGALTYGTLLISLR